jgi:hypothetical protein
VGDENMLGVRIHHYNTGVITATQESPLEHRIHHWNRDFTTTTQDSPLEHRVYRWNTPGVGDENVLGVQPLHPQAHFGLVPGGGRRLPHGDQQAVGQPLHHGHVGIADVVGVSEHVRAVHLSHLNRMVWHYEKL